MNELIAESGASTNTVQDIIVERSYDETRSRLEVGSYTDDNWQNEACCHGLTHLFFSKTAERPNAKQRREEAAKAICEICPVRRDCLEVACQNLEQGIWGGTTEEERFIRNGILPYAPINKRYAKSKQ